MRWRVNYPRCDAETAKAQQFRRCSRGRVSALTRIGQRVWITLYSGALSVAALAGAPYWLWRLATETRWREGLRQRLGSVPAVLAAEVRGRQVVWVHAVSVGETLAAVRLVQELEAALGAGWRVVVSTTTRAGQALARERFGAARVFYFPVDFGWAVRRYLRVLQPRLLLLMESELWPRMLFECGVRGVPVAVANARVSDRSFRRGLRVRHVWGRVLRQISLWLAQSETDAQRLVAMGAREGQVAAVGNLKYDARMPGPNRVAELIRVAANGRPVVVAGSTVAGDPPEESPFLHMMGQWRREAPVHPLLVLAPRQPQEFGVVYSMACKYSAIRASELLAGASGTQADIIVLDTIGDLAAVYGVADVAFVGGSLLPHGGHNPLEPALWGVPVIMGPSFENFRGIVDSLQAADAIRIVADVEALTSTVQELLGDREAAQQIGERARAVFLGQQGATERSVTALLHLLHGADA